MFKMGRGALFEHPSPPGDSWHYSVVQLLAWSDDEKGPGA